MNRKQRVTAIITCVITILSSIWITPVSVYCAEGDGEKSVDMIFTHDIHSFLDSYQDYANGDRSKTVQMGGLARLKTFIDEKRQENPDTLVLDGGDFPMGTLYQTLYSTDAVELRMLGRLGFDATTFGNHDFDYGSEAVANMYEAAVRSGDPLPAFVINNIDWTDLNDGSRMIYDALTDYGMKEYIILNRNGSKIAITGTLGAEAYDFAPECELSWQDPVEWCAATVEKIKAEENPDMIVLLSHSGTKDDPKKSEDEIFAKKIPDIDVIISGHTHTVLDEPIVVGHTTIMSCGCYGVNTGSAHFTQDKKGNWTCDNYELVPMDESIPEDEETKAQLKEFSERIDEQYLSRFGYTSDQVLATNTVQFDTVDDVYAEHKEHNLGDIMADAERYAANQTPSGMEHQVDFACVPAGVIRGTYYKGDITCSDVFNSFSLGIGPDEVIGYPLLEVYFYGSELKTLVEVDASVSDLMTEARLYMSGLSFSYNPHRFLLNQVNDVYLSTAMLSDSRTEIEDDKLYKAVVDLYSAKMLDSVNSLSYGLLSLVPKDEQGNPVEDLESRIIYKADGTELKVWEAIATYMTSFEKDANGISKIPEYYATEHGRKYVDDSFNPVSLFAHPNKFGVIISAVIILFVLIVVLIVRGIIRHKRKKKIFIEKKPESASAAEGDAVAAAAADTTVSATTTGNDENSEG